MQDGSETATRLSINSLLRPSTVFWFVLASVSLPSNVAVSDPLAAVLDIPVNDDTLKIVF